MPQLVYNASIIGKTTSGGPMGQVQRLRQRDVLSDVRQLMGAAGQASDLIDKLGNNELSKMAAAGISEARRNLAIKNQGVPEVDLAARDRQALLNEAVQQIQMPSTQLQEPTLNTGAPSMEGTLFRGSGLPGELHIPMPGEQYLPPLEGTGPLSKGMTGSEIPVNIDSPIQRMAEGMGGDLGSMDPNLAMPVQSKVELQDQHLPKPIQITNRTQALQLAREHGSDPLVLEQIMDSANRLEGLSPKNLFGLVGGDHLTQFRKDVLRAAEEGDLHKRQLRLEQAKLQGMLLDAMNKGQISRQKGLESMAKVGLMKDRARLIQAQEQLTQKRGELIDDRIRNPGKHRSRTTVINRIVRDKERFSAKAINQIQKDATSQLRATEKDLAVKEADLKGKDAEIMRRMWARFESEIGGLNKTATLTIEADKLRKAIGEASKFRRVGAIRSSLRKAGYPELASGDDPDKIIKSARNVLRGLDKGVTVSRNNTTRLVASQTEKLIKLKGEAKKLREYMPKLRAQVKQNKISATKANELFGKLIKYTETKDPKILKEIFGDLHNFGLLRIEDITKGL